MGIRKMRSFRLPTSVRLKLDQLHLRTGKDRTTLLIEAVDLLWDKYGKKEEAEKETA